ncbi:MAG: metallophosphoesterase [Rhabdochlamydiaceae bacterium]|nr:metallophosphoesterase [Rhabdochlamydiaceae bacterium]
MKKVWVFLCVSSLLSAGPVTIYLTLPQDPAHNMSVHWIEKRQGDAYPAILYQKENEVEWKRVMQNSLEILGSSPMTFSYFIKETLITGLEAETLYRFRLDGDEKIYRFRTLPTSFREPLKIAIGGDFTDNFKICAKMNRVAARKNPDFAVLGGDIAYAWNKGVNIGARGSYGSVKKWVAFFVEWQKSMIADGDRMIPVVALVGNHDVTPLDREEQGKNALFFKLFPYEQGTTYRTVDIAGSLSLFLLDTAHLFPVEGNQTHWLEGALKKKQEISWKVPIYHVPAYPSIGDFQAKTSALIRKHWVPLFEQYGVKVAFEHHNHAFKRTYALLKDQIADAGIVYIGDGGWGSSPRKKTESRFYLETRKASSCFSLLTVTSTSLHVDTYDERDTLIDTWKAKPE